jgi:hypothetical protein
MKRLSIYQYASQEMKALIKVLLSLSEETIAFSKPTDACWEDELISSLLLCGKGLHIEQLPLPERRANVWLSRLAIPFNLETAATSVLYKRLKSFTHELIDFCYSETRNFRQVSPDWLRRHPYALPVVNHVVGVFSKQELSKLIGHVSDTRISKPASQRIADLLGKVTADQIPKRPLVRERIRSTTEGIVRDLVGRLLLEEFVAYSLDKAGVAYKREDEYEALSGVVYDFRADFVVPDETEPRAFLEVRKSSSRHASLYAKDKMFSAINWKGRHQRCLGILVIDGPWTASVVEVMSKVFDYVVPIGAVATVCAKIRNYIEGDETVLQWLIHFKITRHRGASRPSGD